jgi:hypothetical protein
MKNNGKEQNVGYLMQTIRVRVFTGKRKYKKKLPEKNSRK